MNHTANTVHALQAVYRQVISKTAHDASSDTFLNVFETLIRKQSEFAIATQNIPEVAMRPIWRYLGVQLYNQTPQPSLQLQIQKYVTPERNSPCDCGSTKKYKQCCAITTALPFFDMPHMNLLRFVLDNYTLKALSEVAKSRANLPMVADTASQWIDEGDGKRAIALLEPYFEGSAPLTIKLDLVFDALMSAHLDLNHTRQREQVIAAIMKRGDSALKAVALQRQATMSCDQGDYATAWQCFLASQKLNPNDPALATLEVLILTSQGRETQAKRCAADWVLRLKKLRNADYDGLIDYLEQCAQDPHAAGLIMARNTQPAINELYELMQTAPAPRMHYTASIMDAPHTDFGGQSTGPLKPSRTMHALQREWQACFKQVKPRLADLRNDALEVWDNAHDWLSLLKKSPELWNSFDVLDDLVMAVESQPFIGLIERMMLPLAERATELLQLHLEHFALDLPQQITTRSTEQKLRCEWVFAENRPALRPIAHLAFICLEKENWERFLSVAQWLVRDVNPNDNHGLRHELSTAYVQLERWLDAIELAKAYPNDAITTQLNSVLALYKIGEHLQAAKVWREVKENYPIAATMLLKPKGKPVKADPVGVRMGGKYEAWLYCERHRPFWEQGDALVYFK